MYTKFNLYIHELVDICVFTFWLLWIILLWTFMFKFLCGCIFISLGYTPRSVIYTIITVKIVVKQCNYVTLRSIMHKCYIPKRIMQKKLGCVEGNPRWYGKRLHEVKKAVHDPLKILPGFPILCFVLWPHAPQLSPRPFSEGQLCTTFQRVLGCLSFWAFACFLYRSCCHFFAQWFHVSS